MNRNLSSSSAVKFDLPCPIMVPGDIKLAHPQLRDIHDDRGLSEENLRLNAFMRSVVDNCQSGV